jgi:hypothetical protein
MKPLLACVPYFEKKKYIYIFKSKKAYDTLLSPPSNFCYKAYEITMLIEQDNI